MDENKRQILKQIGYEIRPCCGSCKHGRIGNTGFGDCLLHKYDHLKHSGGPRALSVYQSGWCPKFEMHDAMLLKLHGFNEFVKEK